MNVCRIKTMIVSRSCTMRLQSSPLTLGETDLEESADLDILGVSFDAKKTFELYLRSVSREASQRLGILRKSRRVFHEQSLLVRCFSGFDLTVFEYCSAVWRSGPIYHFGFWT